MAKRKKKRRINREVTFALAFAVVFVAAVAIMIPVMTQYSERQYAAKLAQEEAERQYRMDLSWIDSDMNLVWLADQNIYELDKEGEWDYTDSTVLLRSYNFANGDIKDIPIEHENVGNWNWLLVPSDDPHGYVLAGEGTYAWSIYRLDKDDRLIPLFYEANNDIKEIVGFYDGQVYCHVYGRDDEGHRDWDALHLVRWDSKTKEIFEYRDIAIALSPDGNAVMLDERSTGLFKTYFSHYDENGKPVEKQREIEGWTMGIEDAQGNWMPLNKIGEDGVFVDVACADWLDDDCMLFAARQEYVEGSYTLYRITFSRGEFSIFTDQAGKEIHLYDVPIDGSMSISPDGRFIAYKIVEDVFKGDGNPVLIVQSLETGRYAQVCPQEPDINENKKVSVGVLGGMNNRMWIE